MGYVNKAKDGRWGLPTAMVALILGLVLFGSVTAPAPALAAAITCGGCHTVPPADADNCTTNASKSHPAHSNSDKVTCTRCHPAVLDAKGIASSSHNNNAKNITSFVVLGLRYNTGTCTNACHKNENSTWGGPANDCNICHYRSGPVGSVVPSGLHAMSDKSWKHFSSLIKVNMQKITCLNCHPVNNNDNTTPRVHINNTSFIRRASMGMAFRNVTVTGVGYVKGATQGTGSCAASCHVNSNDPFGNYTINFKAGQKKRFGAYQSAKWNDVDLKCNECHSTPSQEASFANSTTNAYGSGVSFASNNANLRHSNHMFKYKLNPWNFASQDRNIYCDDCHKTPDINATRGFQHHSTLGESGSLIISLPVKSQNAKVNLLYRNNGIGRDGLTSPSYTYGTTTCSNVYCHTLMVSGKWTEEACSSCHGKKDGVNVGSGAPGYRNYTANFRTFEDYSGGGGAHYTHVTRRGYPCRTCHYDGGGDGNSANHHNVSPRTVFRANVNVSVSGRPRYSPGLQTRHSVFQRSQQNTQVALLRPDRAKGFEGILT